MLVVATVFASTACASIINGGFETGDFSDWMTWQDTYASAWFGGIQVLNSYTADAGTYFAKIPANSTMTQALTWQAGDTIRFRYAFDGTQTSAMAASSTVCASCLMTHWATSTTANTS